MGKRDTGNITTEPQAGAPLRANADACSDQEPRLVEPQTLIRHRYKSVLEESILHSCPQDVHRSRSTKYKLRKKIPKAQMHLVFWAPSLCFPSGTACVS